MKRGLGFLLFLFISVSASAQLTTIFADEFPDSAKTRIGIIANYDLGSNNLTNAFLEKFYTGGYIDSDLKGEVLSRTKSRNRVGANINGGIFGAFTLDSLFRKPGYGIFFSVKDREHFDAAFSKDLFKVGFYGNAAYAGKTADFNGFNMNLLRYQQVQIGIFSSRLDSAARWGIGVSFLKGEQYLSAFAKKAELYTSDDGQYIDFNTSLAVAQSDTAHKGFQAFNGMGASIDIYFEAPFKTKAGNSKIRVSVTDIGLIKYNQNTLYMNRDSLFHFTGFNVSSIYDLQNAGITGKTSQDSILHAIVPYRKQTVTVTLPATLNLSFETRFSRRFELSEGIHYVFNANYNLLYYVKGSFYFSRRFMLSATFSYGGYSTFNYGLGLYANMGKGFIIYAGSNNLEGYLVPKSTTAQGFYLSLIKDFR